MFKIFKNSLLWLETIKALVFYCCSILFLSWIIRLPTPQFNFNNIENFTLLLGYLEMFIMTLYGISVLIMYPKDREFASEYKILCYPNTKRIIKVYISIFSIMCITLLSAIFITSQQSIPETTILVIHFACFGICFTTLIRIFEKKNSNLEYIKSSIPCLSALIVFILTLYVIKTHNISVASINIDAIPIIFGLTIAIIVSYRICRERYFKAETLEKIK